MKPDTKAWRTWAKAEMPGSMNAELAALIRVVNLCNRVEALEALLQRVLEDDHSIYLGLVRDDVRAALEGAE